jgi:hypothetical protein
MFHGIQTRQGREPRCQGRMPHPGRRLVKLVLEAGSRRNHDCTEKLPVEIVLLHLRSHQDEKGDCADLTRPERLNVLTKHRATCCTQYLRTVGQTTEFYPLTACRDYLRDATEYITSREQRTLGTELPECELRAYIKSHNTSSDQVYGSITWPAHRSATAGHSLDIRGRIQSWLVTHRRCSATTDLCPERNEIETVPHLYRYQVRAPWPHRFLIQLHRYLKDIYTAAVIRCILFRGIESWFLVGDTNDPDSLEPIVQIDRKFSKATYPTS